MKMDIEKLNRRTLKLLPDRGWGVESCYRSIYLVPSGLKHESGYMKIAIVGQGFDGSLEVCGYPDDILWDFRSLDQKHSCTGMRTDCLYPNGLLHCWGYGLRFEVGCASSSMDICVRNNLIAASGNAES